MKKVYGCGYGDEIKVREMVKETLQTYTIRYKSWSGGTYVERRVLKRTVNDIYHPTWEEARAWLVARARRGLSTAKSNVRHAEEKLNLVMALPDEEPKE